MHSLSLSHFNYTLTFSCLCWKKFSLEYVINSTVYVFLCDISQKRKIQNQPLSDRNVWIYIVYKQFSLSTKRKQKMAVEKQRNISISHSRFQTKEKGFLSLSLFFLPRVILWVIIRIGIFSLFFFKMGSVLGQNAIKNPLFFFKKKKIKQISCFLKSELFFFFLSLWDVSC